MKAIINIVSDATEKQSSAYLGSILRELADQLDARAAGVRVGEEFRTNGVREAKCVTYGVMSIISSKA